ncbi:MAG: hypothetical protein FWD59_10730 [Micrococcales bacterium]|nr:hypothetical protein [Micrococcales bacterium]
MVGTLPTAFTLAVARRAGVGKDQVYRGIGDGHIERIGRGVFVKTEALDPSLASLAAATTLHPLATMCLTSALVCHGLSDAIPPATDIALPRGTRRPAGFAHVVWRSFDPATFLIGRQPLEPEVELFCYSAERTIIDCFRLAHLAGKETAIVALKRWLRLSGNYPSRLLEAAIPFPKAGPAIRTALEILA